MNPATMRRALLVLGGALALVLITVPAAFEALDHRFPPPLARAHDLSFEVTDRDGRLLRAFANGHDRWRLELVLDEIDPRFTRMLLAYEDRRFWDHPGVDPLALARAAWQCIVYRRIVSGGSTITMQLARLIEPAEERSIGFKLRQIFRALQIERRLDKPEILRLYLTLAPYGGNIEGLRAASLAWFGREPRHLPPAMAAMLIALPQAPETRRPDRHPEAARAARDRVLERLVSAGVLEEDVAEAARREPAPDRRRALPALAPHLARDLASARAGGPERRVATTLDASLQERLEALAAEHAARHGARVSAAILVADHASGEVLAHVGSPDLFDVVRDGAIDMTGRLRSPGSTLKPFIYGIAFESGIVHPETLIDDRPSHFARYAPENFDLTYQGTVTVREALAQSLNVPAIAVLDRVGPQRLLAQLRRAGADPVLPPGDAPGLAIGLGGIGLTLHDLVTLYAALARGGEAVALAETPGVARPTDAGPLTMSAGAAYQVTRILRTTPPPAAAAGGRIAFKTGTSFGHRDGWAIGFDGRYVIGAWVGRPDGAPVAGLSGRSAAAPLLFDAFSRLTSERVPFAPPPPSFREVATADLPFALRHFASRDAGSDDDAAPLVLAFPPDGARVDRAHSGLDRPVPLRAEGGRLPLAWFANGRPVEVSERRRVADWLPDGPGFATLTVVDAGGASARSTIFVETGD